jgi:hypothetical protein
MGDGAGGGDAGEFGSGNAGAADTTADDSGIVQNTGYGGM